MPNRFNDQLNTGNDPNSFDEMWDLLSVYADGEASPEEAVRVEKMLRSDAAYARQLAFVKTTASAVQSFAELDPPASLRSAILVSTSQHVTWTSRLSSLCEALWRSLTPRYAWSLAGLAAAGLLAFVVVQHSAGPLKNGGFAANTKSAPKSSAISPVPSSEADQTDFTSNIGPDIAIPQEVPPVASGTHRPAAPSVRTEVASVTPHSDKKTSPNLVRSFPDIKPGASVARHDNSPGVAIAYVYQPDKDAQFERNPGSVAAPETQPVEIPGDDVHIADLDPAPAAPTAPVHTPVNASVASAPSPGQSSTVHVYVAKLTALPPDPNQVLTRADMARNRALLPVGYDRSALKSIERSETSISILHGSF